MAHLIKVSLKSHKHYKKTMRTIPFFFTFANALFGFLSVIESMEGNCFKAALFICLAACMDLLDGRLARALGTTSSMGGQLDGLCDAISFCFAPVMLLYSFYDFPLLSIGLAALSFYLCAGLWRLARFNCINAPASAFFSGLATPISAFFIASIILYMPWLQTSFLRIVVTERAIAGIIFGLALLMISTIPFPSFKKINCAAWQIYILLALACIGALVCLYYGLPMVLIALSGYIIFSLIWYALDVTKRLLNSIV